MWWNKKPDNFFEIYKDWDSFPSPIPILGRKSHFAGRKEVNKLARWIIDSNGGNVLISGVRGVGKTAFVYHSIYTAHRLIFSFRASNYLLSFFAKFSLFSGSIFTILGKVFQKTFGVLYDLVFPRKKIVFIPINCSTIPELDESESENKRLSLLKLLIESYYYSSIEAKRNSYKLYLYSISNSKTSKLWKIAFRLSSYGRLITSLVLLITAAYYIYVKLNPQFGYFNLEFLKNLYTNIQYLFLTEIILVFSFSYFEGEEVRLETSSKNFNYLQMKFQQLLSQSNKIFVFVIDELDKIYNYDKDNGESISKIATDLKNLITISSGRFIFIAGDKYVKLLQSKITDADPYPVTSTLFNWEIFLPQARSAEIRLFLSNILRLSKKGLEK